MTVRTRVWLLLSGLTAAFLLGAMGWRVLEGRHADLLRRSAINDKSVLLRRLLARRGDQLAAFARDYGRSSGFGKETGAGFRAADASCLWVFDTAGKPVFRGQSQPLPRSLTFPLPVSRFGRVFAKGRLTRFFAVTPAGLLEVAGAAIPARGFVFVGRLWDDARIKDLEALTRGGVVLRLRGGTGKNASAEPPRGDSLGFALPLAGWDGRAVAWLDFSGGYAGGKVAAERAGALLAALLAGAVFLALLFHFLVSGVAGPLTLLAESLKTEDARALQRLRRREHEFGELARLFKKTVEAKNEGDARLTELDRKAAAWAQTEAALRDEMEAREAGLQETLAELTAERERERAVEDETRVAHADLERRVGRLAVLREVDVAITQDISLRRTLTVVLDAVTRHLPVDAAAVLLYNSYTDHLEYAAGNGLPEHALIHNNLMRAAGPARHVATELKPLHIPRLGQWPEVFEHVPFMSQCGFIGYMAVPLISRDRLKGVLEIFHRQELEPDAAWMGFLDALARQAAIAIDNALLFEDLQRTNRELTEAYDTTLEGWSRALELRDKETEGHTRRVTEMTVRLARAFGITEEEVVHIRRGALLHDIGKMGVPDKVLLKPGKLTKPELKVIQQHPVWAYDLLSPIPFLRDALDIPYCHHEKWDGTGYPQGLREEQIPFAARLFAIVDIWDALTSDRPYRAALPEDEVKAYLRTLSGTHLDPRVVDAFFRVMEETGEEDDTEETVEGPPTLVLLKAA